MVAIYWVNHHSLLHHARHASTTVLWCNIVLLFCLSLVPFATAYMGENAFTPFSTAVYSAVMLLAGIAYVPLRAAVAAQWKGKAEYHAMWTRASRKNYVS